MSEKIKAFLSLTDARILTFETGNATKSLKNFAFADMFE
jgi:hypothetical protein